MQGVIRAKNNLDRVLTRQKYDSPRIFLILWPIPLKIWMMLPTHVWYQDQRQHYSCKGARMGWKIISRGRYIVRREEISSSTTQWAKITISLAIFQCWPLSLNPFWPGIFWTFKTWGRGVSDLSSSFFLFYWTPGGSDLLKNGLTLKFSQNCSTPRKVDTRTLDQPALPYSSAATAAPCAAASCKSLNSRFLFPKIRQW